MTKIGVLSDTHGHLSPKLFSFFSTCQELWHAGDIGNIETISKLQDFKPLRAVHGNIDNTALRTTYPAWQRFSVEEARVLITHIGGYPGRYEKKARAAIQEYAPDIFVCGHSHILRIIYDQNLNHLHINPGAAGRFGIHAICTAVRFDIDGKNVKNLEILEYPR